MITREKIFDVQRARGEASPKQIALSSIFFFATFGLAVLLFLVLTGRVEGAVSLGALFTMAFMWTVLLGVVLCFLEPSLALIVFSATTAILLVLFGLHSIFVVLGVLAFFWGMLHAYRNAAKEKAILISFKPFRILRRAFPPFFLGLSIFLALTYQGFVLKGAFSDERAGIPPQVYDAAFWPVENTLKVALPGYESGMPLGEVQNLVVERLAPPELVSRIGGVRNINVSFIRPEFADRSLKEVSFEYLDTNIHALLAPYRDLVPVFFVVGLFLVFQFLSLPFRWAAIGVTLLAIKVLTMYNIATIQETRVVKKGRVLH